MRVRVLRLGPAVGRAALFQLDARGDLGEGEEVTYDYKFQVEAKKIACHCGAANCRKFMN